MKDSYQGPLKSYVLAASFKLFGASVPVLRWTMLVCGAAAVVFMVLLGCRLYGPLLGGLLGLTAATDPALIFGAAYDTGPVIVTVALLLAGQWLLAGCEGPGESPGRVFGAGLCLGLAVWDKAHALWFLAAAPVAAALFAPWRGRFDRRDATRFLQGVALGAAPFLVFNLAYPLATFRNPGHGGWDLGTHARHLLALWAPRLESLELALTGKGMVGLVGGRVPSPRIEHGLIATLAAIPLLGAFLLGRSGVAALRQAAGWLTLLVLVFLASLASPVPVKYHHYYLVYACAPLAAAALWSEVLKSSPARRAVPAALAFYLFIMDNHVVMLRDAERTLAATGGSGEFFRGMNELASWLSDHAAKNPGETIWADDGLNNQIAVATEGTVRTKPLYTIAPPTPGNPEGRVFAFDKGAAKGVVLLRGSAFHFNSYTGYSFEKAAKSAGLGCRPLLTLSVPDGQPWATACRLERLGGRG